VRAVWIAAFASLLAALAMALAIGVVTAIILAVIVGAAWAYNLGLKSTPASGLMYILGFGPIPAYAASTLPGHPLPTWYATAAAALVGLGGHFANVLPDLAADRATGVNGQAQQIAARWGAGTVRGVALVLVLSPSVLLLLASSRQWVALAGLGAAVLLAVIAARGTGRVPLWAVIGIGAVDAVVFGVGGCALT
jgi:4-hydroxybenzoate polyprenyltransferase